MPGIATIEDSEGLRNVEVEEAEGWQGPLLVVDEIDECRKCEYKGPDDWLVRSGRYWEKGLYPQSTASATRIFLSFEVAGPIVQLEI